MRMWTWASYMLFTSAAMASASLVRQEVDLTRTDICPDSSKTNELFLGNGSMVIHLDGSKRRNLARRCNLLVRAERNLGIMLHVHKIYLRNDGASGCIDFLQFGRDDWIPVVTVNKSPKLCQSRHTGYSYDVPGGSLLICKEQREGWRECRNRNQWVQQGLFCDHEIDCAMDQPDFEPADEAEEICGADTAPEKEDNEEEDDPPGDTDDEELEDVRLGTIVAISLGVVVIMAGTAVCCVRKCGKMSQAQQEHHNNRECCNSLRMSHMARNSSMGGGALSGPMAGEVGGQPHHRHHHHTHHQQQHQQQHRPVEAVYPEEPPPAYNDIFPEGYQYTKTDAVEVSEVPTGGEGQQQAGQPDRSAPASDARDTTSSV